MGATILQGIPVSCLSMIPASADTYAVEDGPDGPCLRAQERALEESKGELSRKRSRHGALEEMHSRLEGVGAGTKALVGTGDACVAGLVADRVEAPTELTHALAGLLGARLQDVVVHDVERGVVLLEDLSPSDALHRATQLGLTQHGVGDQHQQLILAGHMPVQRCGACLQLCGEVPHAQRA